MTPDDDRPFFVRANDVAPYCLAGDEEIYESRALIAPHGAGSQHLLVNHFCLHAGKQMARHVHPDSDELYFFLSGNGFVDVGGAGGRFDEIRYTVSPGAAVFIPRGTYHRLVNETDDDLVLLTIWPHLPQPGSNLIYDNRLESWGCSFRYIADATAQA